MYQLWHANREVRRVGVILSGNDITYDSDPDAMRETWKDLVSYWGSWGLDLILIDVVPAPYNA